jgi:hypothetical protein
MTAAVEIEYERPPLVEYQKRAFFNDKRYSYIEAMTKSGKTIGAMAWLLEQAMQGQAINYYWVAPIYPQALIVFERYKRGLPAGIREPLQNPPKIVLPNSHVIWFKGGDEPDSLYGDDVGAAVIDEASRVKEEAFNAVRSTLTATHGPLRCIGNVKGRKNWFYRNCRKAEAGDPNAHFDRITADDAIAAGVISQEEVDDAKRVLSEAAFKELFYCQPSDDAGNPFGIDKIRACMSSLSNRPPVVFGIDLAKSVDWTVVIGLDTLGYVSYFDRWQSPWKETITRIKNIIGRTRTLIDSTGVGDPVVEQIQRSVNAPTEGDFMVVEGVHFTKSSKQQMMEGLASSIHQELIHFPEGPISLELESFEYHYTGKDGSTTGVHYEAMEGANDDCVCALALANKGFMAGSLRPRASMTAGSLPERRDDHRPAWRAQL